MHGHLNMKSVVVTEEYCIVNNGKELSGTTERETL
jgi:hypothetical protein